MSVSAPAPAPASDSPAPAGGGAAPDGGFQEFARLRAGDRDAFRRAVERHAGAVLRTAERVLGMDVRLAEDVTQEVFMLLAQKADGLPDHAHLSAWLHRLTVRRALNTVRAENRRRSRERRAAENHAMDRNLSETADRDDPAWSELRPHLDQALLELREADRQAILMRFFEGRELRSIAGDLGLTAAAAQKRISRALGLLRSRLARRGITTGAALLATLLAEHSARAASAALTGRILTTCAAALPSHASGGATGLFLIMSHLKAVTLGVVLGLCAGTGWNALPTATPPLRQREATGFRVSKSAPEIMAEARFRPAVREASLAGLFSQLRLILREPDHELTRQRLVSLLDQVRPAEFQPLFEMIRDQCHMADHERVYKELAKAWARARPEEAMAALTTVRTGPSFRVGGRTLAVIVFGEWHGGNPAAAHQWLADHSEDPSIGGMVAESMIGKVAQSLLRESPEAVIEWATRLEGDSYRLSALSALWSAAAYGESNEDRSVDLKTVLDQLSAMKDTPLAVQAAKACAEVMTVRHPDALESALRGCSPSEPAWQAAVKFAAAAFVRSRTDRADIAMRLAGDRTPSQAASQILRETLGVTPDLLPWALPLLTGPEREEAILHVAGRQASWDDSAANPFRSPEGLSLILSLPWAAQLSDPAVRDPLIYGIHQRLLMTMPKEAEGFAESSGWPDSLKAILRRAAADYHSASALKP